MFGNFRDILAIALGAVVFPAIWVLEGLGYMELPGEILGATIAIETLIAQFYYRKATSSGTGNGNGNA